MAIEYRGEEIIFLIEIEEENGINTIRPFNQTGGSTNISADSIDLATKDKTGSDYGNVTQEVSLEGYVSHGDPFIDYIKDAIRSKEFVTIIEMNTRTLEGEKGKYMISSFERSFSYGEFASYTLSGSLNGEVTPVTLTEIPTGAPKS